MKLRITLRQYPLSVFSLIGMLMCTPQMLSAQCFDTIWADEFDGTELDEEKWSFMIGDGSNYGIAGWGNNEWQYYREENVNVSDGTLKITAREEQFGGLNYTSSRIRTINKGDWTHGRFEARIRMTEGQGIWPAFWMMPTESVYGGWPWSGEIDIMENIGREPATVHGTIHYGVPPGGHQFTGTGFTLHEGRFADDFHVFAVEREPEVIRWFVDDILYLTLTSDDVAAEPWPFEEDFHFLLNVAVGGNWPGYPDETTIFPQVLEVDYVRVYEDYFPYITGARTVANQAPGVTFAIENAEDGSTFDWSVPAGAAITSGAGTNEISVDWGDAGGDVVAEVGTSCGDHTYTIDVRVADAYTRDFSFVDYNGESAAAVVESRVSGTLTQVDNPDPDGVQTGEVVARYERNDGAQWDVIFYDTEAIPDASAYVTGDRRFFIDVYTDAPVGTNILVQLEDSDLATGDNYPSGRHSRFQVATSVQNEWERLEVGLLDTPDTGTADDAVDHIVILFNPDSHTSHVYHFNNFDSYVAIPVETSVEDASLVPVQFELGQNYPNPFNPSTTISYTLNEQAYVRIEVYNSIGQKVSLLADGVKKAGSHRASFDGSGLPSGVYFYRLKAGNLTNAKTMTLLR